MSQTGLDKLVLHLHPKMVPERTLRFTHTFGLGGMSLVLVLLLVGTGVLLLFTYEPSATGAYDSVAALRYDVPMGQFVRNVHRWGGNALVILAFLHLLRVFFTGAYRGVRRVNWIVGLLLLSFAVGANFTGYLLPWDQLAFWAVTIATSMLDYVPVAGHVIQRVLRGGDEVGPSTLTIFYVLHIVILPVVLVMLLPAHFWLVRKAQGVVVPRREGEGDPGRAPLVPVSPNLLAREAAVALVLVAALLAFSLIVNAPLEAPANPGLSPNPAKAPWYFMGLQELLVHLHPVWAVLLIPLATAALLVRLPNLNANSAAEGVWFISARGRRTAAVGAVVGAATTLSGILLDEYVLDLPRWFPGVPAFVTTGLVPLACYAVVACGLWLWLTRTEQATRGEATQALCAAILGAFVVLTVVGAGFRGEGMAVSWPWTHSSDGGAGTWP
jgi:quinol-cytochrome oxidoreductase complex cytochrome b subunit